ncbi:uncharacterized protein HME9302_00771 [Alteripontixanthobacter maritimus]|uniref:Beta-lactamase-related domain-containing protein n=1 Tax=Alteripontixanthobacter maritimus TaxID=2161824 RepID=A0A369Q3X2_9SPHN|nr:serine hydrolase domain-containing protein [Alteripontixanthobacter maritimus]RDC59581.1 uncharacterized protein HME9302_00771 [Alteripontixanthobacter maritimus]
MAYRNFADPQLSRRNLLRGGAIAGFGALAAGLPAQALWAHTQTAIAPTGDLPWPNVRATVEEYVSSGKVANMLTTFGFGQRDPQVIMGGTLAKPGQKGGQTPVDMDSLYRIYSMTKPITGMAVMMLIDEGKLGLDQPLADILPAFANMQVQVEADGSIGPENLEPAKRPITIRHLLTHTSGLGYGIIQKGPIMQAYTERGLVPGQVSRLPIPGLGRGNPVRSLAKFADELAQLPLVYQPGTQWSYSVSLDLLGRVIEVASGKPFDVFLKERLFEPAGMDSTYFTVPKSEIERFTTNYGVLGGALLPIDPAETSIYLDDPAFAFGGAGLVSSARDYDRFLRMLIGYGKIDGKRVMGELAVRVGTSNLLPANTSTAGTFMGDGGFGAGGRVTGKAFGWGGAAGTAAFADFDTGLRAQLFTQYMPSQAYPIQSNFSELVMKDVAMMRAGS